MVDADIYVKTDAGRDEIRSRARGLSMAVRAILLMVDGQRSVAALRQFIGGSKAPADTLDALLAQGLIAPRGAPPAVATDVLDLVLPTIHATSEVDLPIDSQTVAPTIDRYEQLYAIMNEVVRDFLPAHRRYFFQLKIERATNAGELLELLHDLRLALAKSRGDAFASEVTERLRAAAL